MSIDLEKVRKIYNQLQDSISKEIFLCRFLYSVTEDGKYIQKIVDKTMKEFDWVKRVREMLLDYQKEGKQLVLDGCGHWGGCLYNLNKDIKWSCVSDKNANKGSVFGLPILERIKAVEQFKDAIFVITSKAYFEEIESELIQLGVELNNIINFGEMVADNDVQYYDVLKFDAQEVIVDGGCYNCGSIANYIKHANATYKAIYSFEPEKELYKECLEKISKEKIERCMLYNTGLWSDERELCFSVGETGGSKISEQGEQTIKTCALDAVFKDLDEKPTFIKMDIEGAELEALKGAKDLIKEYSPKLAICVYHKPEDIWEIPNLILEYNPNYKLYLRHYSPYQTETVLYAVNKE